MCSGNTQADVRETLTTDTVTWSLLRSRLFRAIDAHQRLSGEALPAGVGRYPRAVLPGWIVSDVLIVPALQLRDPMSFLILMKSDNASRDSALLRLHVDYRH